MTKKKKLKISFIPEQCNICQIYFVRDPSKNAHLTLWHNKTLHVFCSKSCQSHYTYKYRRLQMCSVCCHRKSDFNMVKSLASDMSIEVNYCSLQCWQIVDQSIELENALKLTKSPRNHFHSTPYNFS